MDLPPFFRNLPKADIPLPEDVVTAYMLDGSGALGLIFEVHKDFEIPPHHHKAQWGTVLKGEVEMTIGGEVSICRPGDIYSIPEGVAHSGKLTAGTIVLDVFEETDRYGPRS